MSEEASSVEPVADPEPTPSAQLTAGGLIRQAREASGLHIAALAVSLKVPVKKLEALEADRLDVLHDAVFVRALASSVCRTLRIDPSVVLARLPQGATRVLPPESRINMPFQSSGSVKGLALRHRLRHPVALAVLALLMAAAIVGFLPELQKAIDWPGGTRPNAASAAPSPGLASTASLPESPGMPAAGAAAEPTAGTLLEDVVREPASGASSAPVAVVSKPAAPEPSAATNLRVDPSAGSNAILAFKARATTWVEVIDARGVVVLQRTLQAGESAAASGALPLQSVVGRADAVEVLVRGKSFELATVSKENVARFEVK